MPELEANNLQNAKYTKFIRVEKRIFFADKPASDSHIDLAERYAQDLDVADAGFLMVDKRTKKLVADDASSQLKTVGDFETQRDETNRILEQLQ